MKKLLLLCSSLLLCGCSAEQMFGQTKPDYDSPYQVTADISFGDFEATADVTRNGKDNWEFSFTEPDHLSELNFVLNDNELTASLGNLSVTTETNDFCKLVPDIIMQSIDTLPDISSEKITESEGILTLNTEVDGKKIIIKSDKNGDLYAVLSRKKAQQLCKSYIESEYKRP